MTNKTQSDYGLTGGDKPLNVRLGFPSEGFGSNPKIDVALTSYHITSNPNLKFNQFDPSQNKYLTNPGIGLSVDTGFKLMGSPVRAEAIVYNNSYFKTTAALALEWKPIEANLPGGLKASFGGVVGVATGYTGHVPTKLEMGPFVPVVAARATIENKEGDMALNMTVIPGPPKTGATALCFSASFKI